MNIHSLTSSLRNLLAAENTTTAANDFSANLKKRVTDIRYGVTGSHRNIPWPHSMYPIVFVEARSSNHEFGELGNAARRNITINWDIIGVTQYGMGSADEREARQNADKEAMLLAANIETIMQNNITVSNTVDWCFVSGANYAADIQDRTYNNVINISVEAMVRS